MTTPAGTIHRVPRWLRPWVERLAELQRAVADHRWAQSTGQPWAGSEAPVEHTHLTEQASFLLDGHLIRTALEHDDRTLAGELVAWYFRSSLLPATDELRRSQRAVTAHIGGRELTHPQLLAARRATTDPAERDALAIALREVDEASRAAKLRWLEAYGHARARLGFDDHAAFVRALHPEVDRWSDHARRWLDDTRDDFLARWRRWQSNDGLTAPRLTDTTSISRRAEVPDGATPAIVAVRETVSRWGLHEAVQHIQVDATERPGKAGFAFCSPVAPPDDVRISVRPGRTLADYAKMLHEFGHGVHFTVGVSHPFDIWRSHPARSEAFGFALERVVEQASWQQEVLTAVTSAEDLERTRFTREATHRLVATGLLYEMARHEGAPDPDRLFVELHEREFGVAVDPVASVNRLQTYLEAQPCYPLAYYQAFTQRERFWATLETAGPDWFLDARGGGAVRSLLTEVADDHPPAISP